ncbi:hypothetical protein [Pleurocapsa sp. PCC 7319]|uniref:hypothetical protein n=1 Tax=Pleurocapsa sp. PCC 7319 TaxID=118161 RepID=UPI000346083C|nr:hypothetical protein [Pleurocapsa sp. PCC 7319]
MHYLSSDKNTLVWFFFTAYTLTALLIIPNVNNSNVKALSVDTPNEPELQFVSQLMLRIALILPLLILINNNI